MAVIASDTLYHHVMDSPVGPLTLVVDRRGAVYTINFGGRTELPPGTSSEENKYACGQLAYELDEYFSGKRTTFSVELYTRGTEFQKSIWSYLTKVPYGTTISYGELARRSGRRGAARAVASAVARNHIPIIIPCHRIIPASGGIGHYALHTVPDPDGKKLKATLLRIEGALD